MLKRGWRWFRGIPTKAQVSVWVTVAVVLIAAAASPSEKKMPEEPQTTSAATTSAEAPAAPDPATSTSDEQAAEPAPEPGYVSREMLGDEWPLTVDEGVLRCDGPAAAGAVFFETKGRQYPVNGIARGRSNGIEIDEIWADDPDIPGAKLNIGVLIDRGLKLCE